MRLPDGWPPDCDPLVFIGIAILCLTLLVLAVDEARRSAAPRSRRRRVLRATILLTLVAASVVVILLRLRELMSSHG